MADESGFETNNDVMDQMISATMTMSNMASLMNKTCENLSENLKEVKIEMNDMHTEINGMSSEIKDLKNEQKETNKHISKLEDTTLVNPREMKKIKDAAGNRVRELLKYETKENKIKYKSTCFKWLYGDLNDEFDIPTSGYVKKINLEHALNFISDWEPKKGLEALKRHVDERLEIKKKIENDAKQK